MFASRDVMARAKIEMKITHHLTVSQHRDADVTCAMALRVMRTNHIIVTEFAMRFALAQRPPFIGRLQRVGFGFTTPMDERLHKIA